MNKEAINLFWIRRDLRLEDNTGLHHALQAGLPVMLVFIFDSEILDKIRNKKDARMLFIQQELMRLNDELKTHGSTLKTYHGKPAIIWEEITSSYNVKNVFSNSDYEPYARQRDGQIHEVLKKKNISFHTFKDHVIFEKDEVMKDEGSPYTVHTAYSKKWKARLNTFNLKSHSSEDHFSSFLRCDPCAIHSLENLGFENFEFPYFPDKQVRKEMIENYHNTRDFPFIEGTSRISMHLRFGTVSIRTICRQALQSSEKWLNELIWREFYQMIIYQFPATEKKSFKPAYDRIEWQNDEENFSLWCSGKTGYPLVDAGMRELNETGFMHNRVRMVVASFLTKHLLIDWRWGEAYFAEKLLDYELASNVGGWQWASGSGCDAAPYFRIFNPESQMNKFDASKNYVRKWVPEFDGASYPAPIIDHKLARERCLKKYKEALSAQFF